MRARVPANGLFMDFLRDERYMSYTELQMTTNFSFLRGASHPDELVEQAAAYGYTAIAITDRNSFAGIVRAHVAAKAKGIRIIPPAGWICWTALICWLIPQTRMLTADFPVC